jgi:uncharacterized Ntn-hydrolase superfamily protein
MTWSIIARDRATGTFGVAIATRFFAVGALCPHAASGVGALSTQALVNPHYGKQGLDLLRAGVSAPEVVKRLVAPDEGREHRQLHIIDSAGRIGQHTGAQCVDWAGAVAGDGFSVAGNMLANERVIQETARAFHGSSKTLPEKLLVLICSTEDYPELNLRVDDHADPLAELRRLYDKAHERFVPYLKCSPSKARPWGVFDRNVIEQEIARHKKPA